MRVQIIEESRKRFKSKLDAVRESTVVLVPVTNTLDTALTILTESETKEFDKMYFTCKLRIRTFICRNEQQKCCSLVLFVVEAVSNELCSLYKL